MVAEPSCQSVTDSSTTAMVGKASSTRKLSHAGAISQ